MKKTVFLALLLVLVILTAAACSCNMSVETGEPEKTQETTGEQLQILTGDALTEFTAPDTQERVTQDIVVAVPVEPDADGYIAVELESKSLDGYSWTCNISTDVLKFVKNETKTADGDRTAAEVFYFEPAGDGFASVDFIYSKSGAETGYRMIVTKSFSMREGSISMIEDMTSELFTGEVSACDGSSLTLGDGGTDMTFRIENIKVPVGEVVTVVYTTDTETGECKVSEVYSDAEAGDIAE